MDASHMLSHKNPLTAREGHTAPLTGQETGSEMLSDQGHLLVMARTGAQPWLCLNSRFSFFALPYSGLIYRQGGKSC